MTTLIHGVYHPDCVFCSRVQAGEYDPDMPGVGSGVVSFEPLHPVVPGHRLFLPENHIERADDDPLSFGFVAGFAAEWAQMRGSDFNIITSGGAAATQTIPHLHVHYVPRNEADGLHLPWTGQHR